MIYGNSYIIVTFVLSLCLFFLSFFLSFFLTFFLKGLWYERGFCSCPPRSRVSRSSECKQEDESDPSSLLSGECQWSISSYKILSLLFSSFQVFDPTSYSILVPKPINHLPYLSLPFPLSLSFSFFLSSSLSSSLDLLSFLLNYFLPLSLTLSFSLSLPLSLLRLEWPSSDHF